MMNYASTCGPQVEIPPPRCVRRRYGLFSVSEMREVTDGTWSHGIRYRSDACAGNVYAWPKPCPPCGTAQCTTPYTITIQVAAERRTVSCTDYLSLTAELTTPAEPTGLPSDAVITVETSCATVAARVTPGGGPVNLGMIPEHDGAPAVITFHAHESVTGATVSAGISAGSAGQLTFEIDPTAPKKKVLDGPGDWISADPFPLYSSVHCMPGGGFAAEARQTAEKRMRNNEECAVEAHLWNTLLSSGTDLIGNPDNPRPLAYALGEIESFLSARRGTCLGTLHINAAYAMPLSAGGCCFLEDDGQRMHTRLGTPIAFGSCYNPRLRPDGQLTQDGQVVIVGTGPVTIQRGPISTYEGMDKETNDYAAIAERTYAVIADCPLVWTVACT